MRVELLDMDGKYGLVEVSPEKITPGSPFVAISLQTSGRLSEAQSCSRCLAKWPSRHDFIANGTSLASGLTYYGCHQIGGGSEGGHRLWGTGVLYDNHLEETNSVNLHADD
jgi:hypothetical protein